MKTYFYVMRVVLGKERKIEERQNKKVQEGAYPTVVRFLNPTEKEYYMSNGKKNIRNRVIYQGYLYLETTQKLTKDVSDEILRDVDVKGFLGGNKPQVLSEQDVNRIIKDDVLEKRIADKVITIDVDSTVKINEGPFINFIGVVKELNREKSKAKVVVKIFDRESVVDLGLNQIEKYN